MVESVESMSNESFLIENVSFVIFMNINLRRYIKKDNIIIDNELKFEEKALCNLLNGFYKNSEKEIKETFILFEKIKQYQTNFPFAIEVNLKIEDFLYKKEYDKFQQFDIKLNEIFKDFSYLNGFANQHKKFILYILKLAEPEKRNEIFEEMINFLTQKFFNFIKF